MAHVERSQPPFTAIHRHILLDERYCLYRASPSITPSKVGPREDTQRVDFDPPTRRDHYRLAHRASAFSGEVISSTDV